MNDKEFLAVFSYSVAVLLVLLMRLMGYIQTSSIIPGTRQVWYVPRRFIMFSTDVFIVGSFLSCSLLVAYNLYFR
jgi:hypothetical protein